MNCITLLSRRLRRVLPLAATLAALPASDVRAQTETEAAAEQRARLERRGAGISAGFWHARGLTESPGVDYGESLAFEAFFAKGLDLHLALENTLGLWVRTQTATSDGGLGGSSTETIRSYIIPQFTSIKFYPVSRPADRFQPFAALGAGFAIAIDDRETESSGGVLGGIAGDGTAFIPGFGIRAQTGTELRGRALGVSLLAKYQWIRFFQEVGGERTFQGPGVELGFVYRFQYR